MHEAKCVNKHWWILKMHYQRQTAVLSVMFMVVGMMFVVPAMIERAQATIDATARLSCCPSEPLPSAFTNVRGHLYTAPNTKFDPPPIIRSPKEITWQTFNLIYGSERGYVVATIVGFDPRYFSGDATFHFNNPARGANTCDTELSSTLSPYLVASCHITGGVHAVATYTVAARPLGGSSANGGDANGGDEGDNSGDTP
jgi:hypothetical protein